MADIYHNVTPYTSVETFPFFNTTSVPETRNGSTIFIESSSISGTVLLSLLFVAILSIGIGGNILVIAVIVKDSKMRKSVTNLMIINLAVADLLIMLFVVPEMVMFVQGRGWLLGPTACKVNRFVMVTGLYCSVLSLLALCVERFVAIVFPFKASELCTRRKLVYATFVIWLFAIGCGLPVAMFNREVPTRPGRDNLCQLLFPGPTPQHSYNVYKLIESAIYYFIPMALQVVLYAIIARRLYASNADLSNTAPRPCKTQSLASHPSDRKTNSTMDTIRARRGVVKMLISSVLLYFLSYSPVQAQMFYSAFISRPGDPPTIFHTKEFFVFVMVITHINAAANPVLYAIFSQNFRRNFKRCLCSCYLGRSGYKGVQSQDTRLLSRRSTRSSTTLGRTVATSM